MSVSVDEGGFGGSTLHPVCGPRLQGRVEELGKLSLLAPHCVWTFELQLVGELPPPPTGSLAPPPRHTARFAFASSPCPKSSIPRSTRYSPIDTLFTTLSAAFGFASTCLRAGNASAVVSKRCVNMMLGVSSSQLCEYTSRIPSVPSFGRRISSLNFSVYSHGSSGRGSTASATFLSGCRNLITSSCRASGAP